MEKRYVCSMKGAGKHLVCRATMSMVALSGLLLWAGSDATADWRIEAGPIFRSSMETEAGGTSHTQLLGLQTAQPYSIRPALSRGRAAIVEANPDDITEIRERIFDDGFVGIDLLTFADGLTVYFGYDSDSQYNEAERSLAFIRTELQPRTVTVDRGTERSRTVQTDLDTDLGVDDRFNGWGVRFDALRSLAFTHGADISLSLGLRGYKDLRARLRDTTFAQTVIDRTTPYRDISMYDTVTDTYVFETPGPIPPAPHYQTDPDPFSDPVILHNPQSTTREAVSNGTIRRHYAETMVETWRGMNQIDLAVDTDLLQLALGIQLEKALTSTMAVSLRPAVLLNAVDIEVNRSEQFITTSSSGSTTLRQAWVDNETESKVLLGVGIEAGLSLTITDRLAFGAFVGYELIDTTTVNVGPGEVDIDLSAYTCSAVLTYDI